MKKIRICSIVVFLSISFLLCCKFTDARDTYSCDLTSDMYNEIVNLVKNECKQGNKYLVERVYVANRIERMYQISKTALDNQTVKRTNSLSGGMAFENKKEKNVSNLLLVLGLLCILFVVILFVKKNRVKKLYVINVVMFVVILFFFGYHYKNYGVKEITYPMIKGQNKIKDSKEIQKIMDVLDLGALDEIPYKKSLDPGQKSGKNNVLKIIMNDNKEMLVVSDENYVVIRKEGEVHLYKKNID